MDKFKLKDRIKEKFGTLSNFSRLAGIDRTALQIVFDKNTKPTKEELQKLNAACKSIKAVQTGNVIDPKKLERLRAAIDECGGVYKFCRDNPGDEVTPGYDENQIYPLLSGKRKRNSDLLKRLYDHFGIA